MKDRSTKEQSKHFMRLFFNIVCLIQGKKLPTLKITPLSGSYAPKVQLHLTRLVQKQNPLVIIMNHDI